MDPDEPAKWPAVCYVRHPLHAARVRLERGDAIAPGDVDMSAFASLHGFDRFANLFVDKVQQLFDYQGVSLNSKHIEVVLRQMTDTAVVTGAGSTALKPGEVVA